MHEKCVINRLKIVKNNTYKIKVIIQKLSRIIKLKAAFPLCLKYSVFLLSVIITSNMLYYNDNLKSIHRVKMYFLIYIIKFDKIDL